MHELFTKVLSKRDLSRAGELFSVLDSEIVNDLSAVLTEIELIISQSDYLQSSNNQSVVEICVTRVLSCIRETKTAERFCPALVGLLETCLNYNLQPISPNNDDPPHAKISADIISSIFLNYDKKDVMKRCLPIAVKFLAKGNKELSKNLASYLSLAAIEYAYLLSPHVDPIMASILAGNYGLCRVLSQIYEVSPEKVAMNAPVLVSLLPRSDSQEKLALLQLFTLIAQNNPAVLESSIPQLCEFLNDSTTALATMNVLMKLAEKRPNLIVNYFDNIKTAAIKNPSTITLAAQILATSGKINNEKAQYALDFILEHLSHVDRTSQTILLHEATALCSSYPVLFSDKVLSCVRKKNSLSQQLNTENNNKTSGGITIVKLNSPISTITTTSTVITNTSGTIIKKNINTTPSSVVTVTTAGRMSTTPTTAPLTTGYTRRVKLGDSRSTGRLHPASNTNRSMTRLHGGSVGGLHLRLSSSQQINQNGSTNYSSGNITQPQQTTVPSQAAIACPVPTTVHHPTGKITSGGVTVTTTRPYSQALNQSTGSVTVTPQNSVSVHHASPALLIPNANQKSVTSFPVNSEVIVSGPTTNVTRRIDNTSVTLLNVNNSIINQKMSTFEPYQIMRDPVQQFCEKNFLSIKKYMDETSQFLPPPTRCTLEERRTKKIAKLHFACQVRGPHCLYSKTCFTMRTRNPKTWIHMMFLDFQVRNYVKENCVLSTREPGVSNLKNLWQILKCETRTFTELVTSHFPSSKDREYLINELRHSGFFDVFEAMRTDDAKPNANELEYQWGCFLCNHPDRAVFLRGNNQTMIEGQLKKKKGKWRLFRRWRTRYFTLSGAHLSCRGASGGESIDVNQIRSVKVSRGARNIPKAFEIFTGDQTLILKPKDGKNAEEWVQCLSIAVAHSQATVKTNSLPARGLGNSY